MGRQGGEPALWTDEVVSLGRFQRRKDRREHQGSTSNVAPRTTASRNRARPPMKLRPDSCGTSARLARLAAVRRRVASRRAGSSPGTAAAATALLAGRRPLERRELRLGGDLFWRRFRTGGGDACRGSRTRRGALERDGADVRRRVCGRPAGWQDRKRDLDPLKNQGCRFEHDFGYGETHLSKVFAHLMMLVSRSNGCSWPVAGCFSRRGRQSAAGVLRRTAARVGGSICRLATQRVERHDRALVA